MKTGSSLRWLTFALALAACPLDASALQASTPQDNDYARIKATADADEASLDATAKTSALKAQRALLDDAIAACTASDANPDFSAFVVVMRLDASGHIVETWRKGDSPLALCVERYARGKLLFVPPRSPFQASLEVSFEK